MKLHILLTIALTGTSLAQGPLTPPPGADPSVGPVNALNGGLPQAAMKTLHQVEPRTAIPASTSTVTINQSGSYYLTGNIVVAASHGIEINASNVTLDLNGFSVGSGANPAEGVGINLSAVANVSITNGSIAGGFLVGVGRFNGQLTPRNVRVTDLSIQACPNWGVLLETHLNNRVDGCMVDGAIGGISATLVSDCSVTGGGITGRIVKGCSVTTPGTSGIVADVVENCYATSAGTAIQAKCLVNSYGTGGGNHDVISAGVVHNVWAEGGSGSGDGIEASVVGNSYGKRQSDLGGTSTGDGVKVNTGNAVVGVASGGRGVSGSILQLAQGSSSGGNGVQADVVSFSRAGNSGGIGIVGSNVFGSFATGSVGKGIYSALIGNSRADYSGQGGLVTDGGVVTSSMAFTNTGAGAEGSVVSGVWAASNGNGIVSSGSVTNSSAKSNSNGGIDSFVVANSYADSNTESAIYSDVVTGSYGTNVGYGSTASGESGGISARKVVSTSYGYSTGDYGIKGEACLISSSHGRSWGNSGIYNSTDDNGLTVGSIGEGSIGVSNNYSYGIKSSSVINAKGVGGAGSSDYGINAKFLSNSFGTTKNAQSFGVLTTFGDGSYGLSPAGNAFGLLNFGNATHFKFNSN